MLVEVCPHFVHLAERLREVRSGQYTSVLVAGVFGSNHHDVDSILVGHDVVVIGQSAFFLDFSNCCHQSILSGRGFGLINFDTLSVV